MEFGKKIQFLRKEDKMSQEKLAERINISRQETKSETKKQRAVPMIITGFILEIVAVCFSYIVQYYDMKQNGSFYTETLEYLRHLPLSLIVIIGVMCIVAGGYIIIKTRGEKNDSSSSGGRPGIL